MKNSQLHINSIRLLLAAICLLPTLSFGQPGNLDLTFSTDGKLVTDFESGDDVGYAVAIQSDGKILAAGVGSGKFALARYNSDGSLDNSFGSDGLVTEVIGTDVAKAYSIKIQDDGKILLAGYAYYNLSSNDFVIARFNVDGSLDDSFGSSGIVNTGIAVTTDYATSCAIQDDGKIVVGGYSYNGGGFNADFSLACYNSDGNLDNTFGIEGTLSTELGSFDDIIFSIALQSDGKIIAAGESDGDFALARYNVDGTLDNSFGGDGTIMTDIGSDDDIAKSVCIQTDGRILVAGYKKIGGLKYDFVLARYKGDGTLDDSFGSGGIVISDLAGNDDKGYSVLFQNNGKIIVAGCSQIGDVYDFSLIRFKSDGTVDNSFGTDGVVFTDFGSDGDFGYSAALETSGKIVVVGQTSNGMNYDFAIARYFGDGATNTQPEIDISQSEITISPNPFTTELIINAIEANGEIIFFDALGNEILRQKIASSQTKINTENLLPGVYLLNYTSGNKMESFKLIKN